MEESIISFFEQWTEEFGRAVEMFTGERPTLGQKPAEKGQAEEWEANRSNYQWWQQEAEEPETFRAWVGAVESCWTALTGSSGDTNEAKDLFQEIVSQANQGAAAVLSASFPHPIKFGSVSLASPGPLPSLRVAQISVSLKSVTLPPLIFALEPRAAQILEGPAPSPSAKSDTDTDLALDEAKISSSALDRLMDLHFPVSVLLGQTSLPIRDALKITSGSLVELDRQLGDYVEVTVHGTVVARGEIVAVRGNYGVRIKEVISRKDRLALKNAA